MIARQIMRSARGITFVSQDLKRRFNALADTAKYCEQTVAPMGVERTLPDQAYLEHLVASEPNIFTIATLGRLVPIKGIDLLIQAMKDIPKCRLLVAGEGPEKAKLMRLARTAGITAQFLGYVTAAQRESIMRHADLFVQPSRVIHSRQEGCPVAVLEALDAGVPALMSATGGMREIAEKTGLMSIKPDQISALRNAITRYLSDADFRQVQQSIAQQQQNRWGWPTVIASHETALLASYSRVELPRG